MTVAHIHAQETKRLRRETFEDCSECRYRCRAPAGELGLGVLHCAECGDSGGDGRMPDDERDGQFNQGQARAIRQCRQGLHHLELGSPQEHFDFFWEPFGELRGSL